MIPSYHHFHSNFSAIQGSDFSFNQLYRHIIIHNLYSQKPHHSIHETMNIIRWMQTPFR